MPVERSDFLLFMFKLFNNIYDTYVTVSDYTLKLYDSVYNTVTGLNSKWVFLSSYNIPIPLMHTSNNLSDIIWNYDELNNTLQYNCNTTNNIKIPWLSSKIVAVHNISRIKQEYSIDSFIETLKINTIPINAPSLYLIITLWSIKNKTWFTREYSVKLYIIDEMGDEQEYSLDNDNIYTTINRNKLFITHKVITPSNNEYTNDVESESANSIPDTMQIIESSSEQ